MSSITLRPLLILNISDVFNLMSEEMQTNEVDFKAGKRNEIKLFLYAWCAGMCEKCKMSLSVV